MMRRQRLHAVACLSDHLYAADLSEQVAQLVARELLVVDQYRSQVHRQSGGPDHPVHQAVIRSGSVTSGISMLAHVPRPTVLVSLSW